MDHNNQDIEVFFFDWGHGSRTIHFQMSYSRELLVAILRLSLCVLPSMVSGVELRSRTIRAISLVRIGLRTSSGYGSSMLWLLRVRTGRWLWVSGSSSGPSHWREESRAMRFYVLGGILLVVCRSCQGEGLILGWFGLELQAFSGYLLIRRHRKTSRAERSLQYLLLSRVGSVCVLLGLYRSVFDSGVWSLSGRSGISGLCLVRRLGVKMGARPFHVWTLLVFSRRPSFIRGFLRTIGKLGRFDFSILRLGTLTARGSNTLGLKLVIGLSLLIGSIGAVGQTNLYSLLRYSGISHRGFFLLRILCGRPTVAAWYGLLYRFSRARVWHLVGRTPYVSCFTRMNRCQSVRTKVVLTVRFRSMAGFPPFLGFTRKAQVFQRRVNNLRRYRSMDVSWLLLRVVVRVSSMIGFLYTLNLIRAIWFPERLSSITRSQGRASPILTVSSGRLPFGSRRLLMPLCSVLGVGIWVCLVVLASLIEPMDLWKRIETYRNLGKEVGKMFVFSWKTRLVFPIFKDSKNPRKEERLGSW